MLLLVVTSLLLTQCYAASPFSDPHFVGNRTTIVQLMDWTWEEIAKECEIFLGPYGFGGVQTSPPNENSIIDRPFYNEQVRRPWYERYQPISYVLKTRSGDENQFRDMVSRCNKVGVRIYVDIVLNHMTAGGQGNGTAGNSYDADALSYPAVGFTARDFHDNRSCHSYDGNIHDFDDPIECRNCRLVSLRDLDQSSDVVQKQQKLYLNHLMDLGVAGFRCDASKHMWPQDLNRLFSSINTLNETIYGKNKHPFMFHETTEMGQARIKNSMYTPFGRIIEFRFLTHVATAFRNKQNLTLSKLKTLSPSWGMLESGEAVTMMDNHDSQRLHNGAFVDLAMIISWFQPKMLRLSTAFMLSWSYGVPKIMSSFYWPRNFNETTKVDANDWMGPPHDSNFKIAPVKRNPDLTCDQTKWICEHRWKAIYKMVEFRNVAGSTPVENWWDNGSNQIAFSRGKNAFFAINMDQEVMNVTISTGLASGRYCDVINGVLSGDKCLGPVISVDKNGKADIVIDSRWDDPMVAIHLNSKI